MAYLEVRMKNLEDVIEVNAKTILSHSCQLDTIRNEIKCVRASLKSIQDPLTDTPGTEAPSCGKLWDDIDCITIQQFFDLFIVCVARHLKRSNVSIGCQFKKMFKEGRIIFP